jgi:hypothetical protein
MQEAKLDCRLVLVGSCATCKAIIVLVECVEERGCKMTALDGLLVGGSCLVLQWCATQIWFCVACVGDSL